MSSFTYTPLPDSNGAIRLLRLLSSLDGESTVQCELFQTTLSQRPHYEALSYTWGDTTRSSVIYVDGLQLHVGQNLASALYGLRRLDGDRILWVDALCINQADVQERNDQVRQMRNIYCSAQKVLVWFGKGESASKALRFCRKIVITTACSMANMLFDGHDEEWLACEDLFLRRPWWSRTWILQEVIGDKEAVVHFDKMAPVALDHLCSAFLTYRTLKGVKDYYLPKEIQVDDPAGRNSEAKDNFPGWLKTGGQAEDIPGVILRFRRGARASDEETDEKLPFPPRLSAMLLRTRNQLCTDPRDKVFAFLGMTVQEYDIPIDYRLSKRQVYTHTTRLLLQRILLVLLWVECPQRRIGTEADLPSWVPDLTKRQSSVTLAMNSNYNAFAADQGFPTVEREPRLIEKSDNGVLVIRGIHIAYITATRDVRMTDQPSMEGNDTVRLIKYCEPFACKTVSHQKDGPWLESPGGKHRSTYRNTSWGPSHCQAGDMIVIAAGCKFPLVLRAADQDFLFIGACWLIDSELQDVTQLYKDPGFSPLVFGAACAGIGKSYDIQHFRLT